MKPADIKDLYIAIGTDRLVKEAALSRSILARLLGGGRSAANTPREFGAIPTGRPKLFAATPRIDSVEPLFSDPRMFQMVQKNQQARLSRLQSIFDQNAL